MQGTQNSQNKLEKKNKVGHILLDFKAYKSYKTITYWHKGRHIHQQNRIESPRIKPLNYGQLIFTNGAMIFKWGNNSLFNKQC